MKKRKWTDDEKYGIALGLIGTLIFGPSMLYVLLAIVIYKKFSKRDRK